MKIKIGGIDYDLKFVDGLTIHDNADKINGNIRYQDSKIEVEERLSNDRKVETIIHECVHGLFNHANNKPDDEENVVNVISKGIFQLLRDNPQLYKMIMVKGYFSGNQD